MTEFANEVVEPLINKDGSGVTAPAESHYLDGGSNRGDSITMKVKLTAGQTLWAGAVCAMTVAGAAASAVSFVLSPTVIVYVAGGLCCLHVPFVLFREKKMLELPTLMRTVNEIRKLSDALEEESCILKEEIDCMHCECSRFDHVERDLLGIVQRQGHSVDSVTDLLRQNEEILDLMKDNLRRTVIEDVIRITVASDLDNNQRICRDEAKLLALKIAVQLEEHTIAFDESKFMQAVALNPTLCGVVGIVRKLLPTDAENNMTDEDTASVYSAVSRRYSLEEKDDVYDMFYLDESVERRRGASGSTLSEGSRLSLAPTRIHSSGSMSNSSKDLAI